MGIKSLKKETHLFENGRGVLARTTFRISIRMLGGFTSLIGSERTFLIAA